MEPSKTDVATGVAGRSVGGGVTRTMVAVAGGTGVGVSTLSAVGTGELSTVGKLPAVGDAALVAAPLGGRAI